MKASKKLGVQPKCLHLKSGNKTMKTEGPQTNQPPEETSEVAEPLAAYSYPVPKVA